MSISFHWKNPKNGTILKVKCFWDLWRVLLHKAILNLKFSGIATLSFSDFKSCDWGTMSSAQDGCWARESEERCKRLLWSFRVAKLQNLLRLYGQPRTRRKTKLYQIILNFFRCQDHKQLEERIKHLYLRLGRWVGSQLGRQAGQ